MFKSTKIIINKLDALLTYKKDLKTIHEDIKGTYRALLLEELDNLPNNTNKQTIKALINGVFNK